MSFAFPALSLKEHHVDRNRTSLPDYLTNDYHRLKDDHKTFCDSLAGLINDFEGL